MTSRQGAYSIKTVTVLDSQHDSWFESYRNNWLYQKRPEISRLNNSNHLTIGDSHEIAEKACEWGIFHVMAYAFFLIWWTHVHDRVNVWISILRMIKSVKNRFIISTLAHHFFCLVTKICNNMHIWFLIPHINQINSETQGQLISLWLNLCIG